MATTTQWNKSPWDTSYTYTTPGYSNYAATHPTGMTATGGYGTVTVPQTPPIGAIPTGKIGTQVANYETNLLKGTPGYDVVQSHVKGELPSDVLTQLYQRGAERGVAMGNVGGAGTNAATIKDLGLTSLDLQKTGLAEQTALMGALPNLDPQSLYVGYPQFYGATVQGALTGAELGSKQTLQDQQLASEAARQAAEINQRNYAANLAASLKQQELGQQAFFQQQAMNRALAERAASGEALAASLGGGGYSAPASYGTTTEDQAYQNWQNLFGGLASPGTGGGSMYYTDPETGWPTSYE